MNPKCEEPHEVTVASLVFVLFSPSNVSSGKEAVTNLNRESGHRGPVQFPYQVYFIISNKINKYKLEGVKRTPEGQETNFTNTRQFIYVTLFNPLTALQGYYYTPIL